MRSLLLWICTGLVFAFAAPVPGLAQEERVPIPVTSTDIDYAAWETEAERAESIIAAAGASTAFLQSLRNSLVDWRAQFLTAQNGNDARIATIQAQIEALGPEPAEGVVEPEAIATRRADLESRLAAAQLPRVNASEAFNRANGLISEIDGILADRQAQALLELDPTPLNPVNWGIAFSALADLSNQIYTNTITNLRDPVRQAAVRDALGTMLLTLVVGLTLLVFGRRWVERGGEWLMARRTSAGRVSLIYFVSLGQLALPVGGIVLLLLSFTLTGMTSDALTTLLEASVGLVIAAFFGLWLSGRLYPRQEAQPAAQDTARELRPRGRRSVVWIGLFTGLAAMAEAIASLDAIPPTARGVLLFPIYVGLSLGYWRLAKFILLRRNVSDDTEQAGFTNRVSDVLARALQLVGVIGPLLAAVGYLNAAQLTIIPTALSLGVFGVLLSLQPVIRDLYALVFRTDDEAARGALTPVLINFALVFAALPILALIWGMRSERLGDIYTRFLEGFSVGDTRITPLTVLAVVVVFGGFILATRLMQGALKSTVLPRTKMDAGAQNAIISGVGYVGIALAAIIAITSAGIDLTALGFVIGALSVGIGLGLQNVVANFVSGIILLIERPISVGDWIEVNGNMGIVKDISVRSTRIETFDKTDVIVPNADFISGTVTNWTRGNTIGRAVVTVGVAYGTDTRRVQEILLEIARNHPVVATFPEPGVDFLGFGADSLDFRIRAILRDVNQLIVVKTELNHQIAERFAKEGIEIPFAQRDVWLRNPEALPGASAAAVAPAQSSAEPGATREAQA